MKNGSSQNKALLKAAKAALKKAHAPYSKFRVGAAFVTTKGEVFTGCNVENASYGLCNCAERTAIFTAVAKLGGQMRIKAIAVANDQDVPCSPCGACRQVIYEFGPEATVYFLSKKNEWTEVSIKELLPEGFRLS